MALFKRRPENSAPEAPPQAVKIFPGTEACSEGGCKHENAVRCSYTDRLGQRCNTNWCPGHVPIVAGQPYCRRHANVVTALQASPFQEHLPDLGNRAASLATWVSDDLDVGIRNILRSRIDTSKDQKLTVEPLAFFYTAEDQRHRWERSWKVVEGEQVVLQVTIDVAEAHDCSVRFMVDSRSVADEIPPWVGWENRQRLLAQNDAQADRHKRLDFYADMLGLISDEVTRRRP